MKPISRRVRFSAPDSSLHATGDGALKRTLRAGEVVA